METELSLEKCGPNTRRSFEYAEWQNVPKIKENHNFIQTNKMWFSAVW